jgi:hypothetical protein
MSVDEVRAMTQAAGTQRPSCNHLLAQTLGEVFVGGIVRHRGKRHRDPPFGACHAGPGNRDRLALMPPIAIQPLD